MFTHQLLNGVTLAEEKVKKNIDSQLSSALTVNQFTVNNIKAVLVTRRIKMMWAEREVYDLLKKYATPVGGAKHDTYRLPDNTIFILSRGKGPGGDRRLSYNNLAQLRRRLGLQTFNDKTQETFEHKKKDQYVKPVVVNKPFLGDLPEREERPPTPISESPLVHLKRQEEKQKEEEQEKQRQEEEERRVFQFQGHIPIRGIRGGARHCTGRSGEVKVYSSDVKQKATEILQQYGQEEVNRFLANTQGWEPPKGEDTMTTYVVEGKHNNGDNSLEILLQQEKEMVQKYKAQINLANKEVTRHQRIVDQLEEALKLQNAPLASIDMQAHFQSSGKTIRKVKPGENVPFGYWKEKIKETILTSPSPLFRHELIAELRKICPGVTVGEIATRMSYYISSKKLVTESSGHMAWKGE